MAVEADGDFVGACEESVKAVTRKSGADSLASKARNVARANDWDVIAEAFWEKVGRLMAQGGRSLEV